MGKYKGAEVELIINGDFFNYIQVDPDEHRPTYVNERVALARTGAILDGHAEVFDALKVFADAPYHKITIVIGNHDFGLFFASVRRLILERLGPKATIYERPRYIVDGLAIEHGSQFTVDNWMDYDNPFVVSETGERIVNLPWGNFFCVHFLNRVKRERTYVTRVYPFKNFIIWSLMHDTIFAFKALANMAFYFLKALFRIGENRRFHTRITVRVVREFSFPMKLRRAARRILAEHPECKVVLMGHSHGALQQQFEDGREYINTGVWNEMISLNVGNLGRSVRLTFAEIAYDKSGEPQPQLKEWHGKYKEVAEVVSI